MYARTVCKVTCPAKVNEKIDLFPGAHAPWRRVRAGLLPGPALAWRHWQYHCVSLSALPSKGLTARPWDLIRGRMTQVVLLHGWLFCLGWGDGDFDQADGVVCLPLGGLDVDGVELAAAAAAKERVVCLAPGLRELATATLYCRMTSGFLADRGMTVWKANKA